MQLFLGITHSTIKIVSIKHKSVHITISQIKYASFDIERSIGFNVDDRWMDGGKEREKQESSPDISLCMVGIIVSAVVEVWS